MSDEQYGYGENCTWHGPLTFAAPVAVNRGDDDQAETPVCPSCGLPLQVMSSVLFWANVSAAEKQHAGYDDMMRWSEGKCFPDFDTLENAWRQHIEGRL
jgi:hypothetical protein